MKLRNRLFAYSCLVMLVGPGTALAQAPRPAASAGPALDEVVVTAQRREESLQDVPIAITVQSAARMEAAAVQSLPDIARITPGLQFQALGASSVPFLRGVGAQSSQAGVESVVALVVDGVYISAQPASLMALPNVETVEIDRGPQGTLFGRNAVGGVIQIQTKRPGRDPKLDVRAGYGNYATWDAAIYGSTPLTDTLSADISLYATDQTKGFGKNLFNGGDVYTNWDYAVRSKWVWQATPSTEVTFIADYEKLRTQIGFANRTPRLGELGLDQRVRGGYQFVGGFYDVNSDFDSFNVTKTRGGSLDIRQNLGFANLRSITAYHDMDYFAHVNFDLGPNFGSHQTIGVDERTLSQEFQLLSPDSSDRLQWVVGVYLYRDLSRYKPILVHAPAPVGDLLYGTKQSTDSWSAFAQGSYKLTDATRLTVGLRHTEDGRDVLIQANTPPFNQTGHKVFQKLTYRFALDHKLTDNVLAYASYSTGYKAGFFNNQGFQPANSTTAVAIKPETLDSVEAGVKSNWLDHRLRVNVSAFNYDYQNQQVTAFIGATRVTSNAASSKIKGVDFEIMAEPVENLTLSFNGEYLDAKYKDYPGAVRYHATPAPGIGNTTTPFNAAGKYLLQSPKFSGTVSVNYKIRTRFGKVILNTDLYHNDGYYFDVENTRRQKAYDLLSASAKVVFGDHEQWDVSVWGANLTNEEVYSSDNPVALGPASLWGGDGISPRPPRMYGVRVGAHF